jgi:hypothetical protein
LKSSLDGLVLLSFIYFIQMAEDNYNTQEEIFSKKIRAGKRTYFFDVKATRNSDYYVTITESKRSKFDDGNYIKTKIHLYKEDFNKFSDALNETISHVKSNLLPEYDFDEYVRRDDPEFSAEI